MNTLQLRTERNEAARILGATLGKSVSESRISQSLLRSGIALAASGSYQLSFSTVTKTGSNVLSTDVLLNQNDAFMVSHIAVKVSKVVAATPTAAQQAIRKFYTYANQYIFDGAAGDANMQSVYNGLIKILQNQGLTFPYIDASRFERVPDTQEGNPAAVGPLLLKRDSKINELWGFVPVMPFVVKGDDQLFINLNMPGNNAITLTETNETNYLDIELRGWILSSANQ